MATRFSLWPSSSSLPQPGREFQALCPQVPLWPLQGLHLPTQASCRPLLYGAPRGGPRRSGGAQASVACSATCKQWGRAAQQSRLLLPAHYGAGPQGPRQTWLCSWLGILPRSKLPACSPTAHGARPTSRPALPPLPPAVAARSYGAAAAGTLRRRIPARR